MKVEPTDVEVVHVHKPDAVLLTMTAEDPLATPLAVFLTPLQAVALAKRLADAAVMALTPHVEARPDLHFSDTGESKQP